MFEKLFSHILEKPLLSTDESFEYEELLETGFEKDYILDPEYTGNVIENKYH